MKKRLTFEFVLPTLLPAVVFLYWQTSSYMYYNMGICGLEHKRLTLRFILDIISLVCLFVCSALFVIPMARVLFFLYKVQIKKAFCLALIWLSSFSASVLIINKYPPGYMYFMKGFECIARDKIHFEKIKEWLSAIQVPKSKETLEKNKWPDFINSLSPDYVILDITQENKKYMRLIWGGPPGHYGVIIGADSKSLPQDVFFISEYRKDIENDVFVWHELKRK